MLGTTLSIYQGQTTIFQGLKSKIYKLKDLKKLRGEGGAFATEDEISHQTKSILTWICIFCSEISLDYIKFIVMNIMKLEKN